MCTSRYKLKNTAIFCLTIYCCKPIKQNLIKHIPTLYCYLISHYHCIKLLIECLSKGILKIFVVSMCIFDGLLNVHIDGLHVTHSACFKSNLNSIFPYMCMAYVHIDKRAGIKQINIH